MPSDKNIKFATLAVFLVMVLVAVLPFRLDRSTTALVRELRAELDQQQRLERMLDGLRDAENAQRGFVITGNDAFLEPYRQAGQILPAALREAAEQARSDAERAEIERIARLAGRELADLDDTVALRAIDGGQKTRQAVEAMHGKAYMDELRRLVGERRVRTEARREEMRSEMLATSRRSFVVSLGATLINICVFGALLLVLARMLRERQETARRVLSIPSVRRRAAMASSSAISSPARRAMRPTSARSAALRACSAASRSAAGRACPAWR